MKTIKHFNLFTIIFIFVVGLLVSSFLVQASNEYESPNDKIKERRAFVGGVSLVQNMRLDMLRALRNRGDKLAGIDGVKVLVENLHTCSEQYGLTHHLLQTDVELRLRMHGIKINASFQPQDEKLGDQVNSAIQTSFQNWEQAINAESNDDFLQFTKEKVRRHLVDTSLFKTSVPPTLYINVASTVSEESRRAAFSIQVKLNEGVYLSRNGSFEFAPVWETSYIATCSLGNLKEYVRECLKESIDEFINAYLAANPKDRLSENES